MIFFEDEKIIIRNMVESDAQIITDEERAQGWDSNIEKYEMRLKDQCDKKSIALVAQYNGNIAGYVNVYLNSNRGAFKGKGYPEIVDFGVLEKYRKYGIGSKLMDVAEQVAKEYSNVVYLGVGLHSGYGSAQRMYVKRGYVPDGSGVWYKNRICKQNEACYNDNDLVLYLSKTLR